MHFLWRRSHTLQVLSPLPVATWYLPQVREEEAAGSCGLQPKLPQQPCQPWPYPLGEKLMP